MRADRSKAVAVNVFAAIRDNVTRYLRDEISYEEFGALNRAHWARAERAGQATVRRVAALLDGTTNRIAA